MSESDPGTPYEGVPSTRERQRRYGGRRDTEDDAWAAAEEDDLADSGLEIEDLAAGYVDEGLPPLPPPPVYARPPRHTPDSVVPRSPHDQTHWEIEPYERDRAHAQPPRRTVPPDGGGGRIPVWAIALLVTLALLAVLALALALAAIVALLG